MMTTKRYLVEVRRRARIGLALYTCDHDGASLEGAVRLVRRRAGFRGRARRGCGLRRFVALCERGVREGARVPWSLLLRVRLLPVFGFAGVSFGWDL